MGRKILIALLLLTFGAAMSAAAADTVTFKSTSKTKGNERLMLTGNLTRPDGHGPFPAVVLLHGCQGITAHYQNWLERLAAWDYVALIVDSFGPRHISSDCSYPFHLSRPTRVQDAYSAKSYLAGLQFVDRTRTAVMGWSYGAGTTLSAVSATIGTRKRENIFRVGVAFYPRCRDEGASLDAPLLILIGGRDDWTRADWCEDMKKTWLKEKSSQEVILKIYPGAHHGFDVEGLNKKYRGHRMQYHPEAAADAIVQVKNFLAKHMK
jgi:dienelactone hydrolase